MLLIETLECKSSDFLYSTCVSASDYTVLQVVVGLRPAVEEIQLKFNTARVHPHKYLCVFCRHGMDTYALSL